MRRLVSGALAGLLSFSLSADAGERNWYVAIEGGANWGDVSSQGFAAPLCGLLGLTPCAPDQSVDGGWAIFGAVGKQVFENFRIEGEISRRTLDLGGYEFSSTAAIANVICDIPVSEAMTVSLGAGAGAARLLAEGTGSGLTDSDTSLAYQAIGAVSYDISPSVALTATFRYSSASGNLFARVKDLGDHGDWVVSLGDVDTSSISVGLRFAL